MTDSTAISSIVRVEARAIPGAARPRPDQGQPPERRLPEGPTRSALTKGDGTTLPKPLLSGETSLLSQVAAPAAGTEALSEEEKQKVQALQARDREVRAHEAAHKLAGGPHAGHPTFRTVRGPDGRSYAVSGEVKIDTATVPNNPDATIRKMEIVKRTALAPMNPSAADRQVAAEADAKIQQARQEKREKEAEEREKAAGDDPTPAFSVAAGPYVDAADKPRHDVLI